MVGFLRLLDTLDHRRKYYYERSDEGSQRVKAAPGSRTAERRMECTKRRHVGSRKVSVSIKNVHEGRNPSRLQRAHVPESSTTSPILWKLNHIVETESGRVVEQMIDVPGPQIVEEIVEVEQIVDVTVPQIASVFLVFLILSFFCAVAWSVALFLNSLLHEVRAQKGRRVVRATLAETTDCDRFNTWMMCQTLFCVTCI